MDAEAEASIGSHDLSNFDPQMPTHSHEAAWTHERGEVNRDAVFFNFAGLDNSSFFTGHDETPYFNGATYINATFLCPDQWDYKGSTEEFWEHQSVNSTGEYRHLGGAEYE
jgi:hypothetical protein